MSGGFAYPLSRALRAQLELMSGLARSVFYCLLMAVMLPPIYWVLSPVRRRLGIGHDPGMSGATILLVVGVALAIAPVAQWISIHRGVGIPNQMMSRVRAKMAAQAAGVALLILMSGGALWFAGWTMRLGVIHSVLIIVTLVLVMHGLYWLALRRDAARSDLA